MDGGKESLLGASSELRGQLIRTVGSVAWPGCSCSGAWVVSVGSPLSSRHSVQRQRG